MLSAILGAEFFDSCYNPLGEILEIIVLINSATNFILYCLMSSQFRNTGRKLLRLRGKSVSGTFRRMSSIKLEVGNELVHLTVDVTLNIFLHSPTQLQILTLRIRIIAERKQRTYHRSLIVSSFAHFQKFHELNLPRSSRVVTTATEEATML